MNKSLPQYRINYLYCKEKDHQFEKANLICLTKQCAENSLICSLCIQHQHKNHSYKPLKHFLSQLQQQYQNQTNFNAQKELQELQNNKAFLLTKINQAVSNLAQRFMHLQEQIIKKYEIIKSQILQRESKRNRFNVFYQSMAFEGKGDPNFQIQNYLQFQPLQTFNIDIGLEGFIKDSNNRLEQIKNGLILKKKQNYTVQYNKISNNKIEQPKANQIIYPSSIKKYGNNFVQLKANTKQTLGYLNVLLCNWNSKLRMKMTNLPVTAKLCLGVAKLSEVIQAKGIFPMKNQQNIQCLDNKGGSKKHEYNYITQIKTGDVIDIFVQKNNLKIKSKNNMCCFHLHYKQDKVVYFSMQGLSEIQMIYPYYKS